MVRNPAYTRKAPWSDRSGPPQLDAVVWKFIPEVGTVATLESSETQGIYLVPAQSLPRLEKNPGLRVEKMPWPGVPRIWLLNVTRPLLDDERVRRTINLAVDKDAFLATVYRGTGLKAFAPLTAVMLDDPSLRQASPFDAEKAVEPGALARERQEVREQVEAGGLARFVGPISAWMLPRARPG
jgi:peptide/nickel transport system substrate-binding protein